MRIADYERLARERYLRLELHRVRWHAIAAAEIADGRRLSDRTRNGFRVGERVLLNYPDVEGVVIRYEDSSKKDGGDDGARSYVRWSDGTDALILHDLLVSVDFEEELLRASGDDSLRRLLGVDRGPVPHRASADRAGRLG